MGAQGRVGLSVGGKLRVGHLHSSVPGKMISILVHFVAGGGAAIAATVEGVEMAGQDPT